MSIVAIAGLVLTAAKFFADHSTDIKTLVDAGKPILEAAQEVAPQAIPALKNLASQLFGNLPKGQALETLLHGVIVPQKMTREQEEAWFQRASGANTG